MTAPDEPRIDLREGRFARFEAIHWWDQERLRNARVLVVGAGALGNEVIKNFALLGLGRVVVVDMDRIEQSNLSRSVLFRPADEGTPKAKAAARAAHDIYDGIQIIPIVGNVLADVGLGYFRWAQVVVGALDNREARVFVNQACAQTGTPWIDGGIEVLGGVVRGFHPPESACYECTMGRADWEQLEKRRSCSLLARQAAAAGGAPTTPTTASVIGAMQAQEVVKALHGMAYLSGRGFVFEGANHSSYLVEYPVSPDCPWHEPQPEIVPCGQFGAHTPMADIAAWARERLGGLDALDFARELISILKCPACGAARELYRSIEHVREADARCAACGAECVPEFYHGLEDGSPLMRRSAAELGLPAWDILWARAGEKAVGIELTGDCPPSLGEKTIHR